MLKVAIIGAGGMATAHVKAYQEIKDVKVVAVCDILPKSAKDFAQSFAIENYFCDVDEMLSTVEIDAVSVVTPDALHKSITLKVLAASKHVLCEKPLATNYADAKQMCDAATNAGVINMVNLSYRNAPSIHKAKALVESGEIGLVKHVNASYLQSWLSSNAWGDWKSESKWLWRLSTKHGSKGVLGDVGVHILDLASFPVGDFAAISCQLKTFAKAPNDQIGEYPLDANDSAIISAQFGNGALAAIQATRWATGNLNTLNLSIFGDKGAIEICLKPGEEWNELKVCSGENVNPGLWESIICEPTPTIYQRFVESIRSGVNDEADFARGAALQKALDQCEASSRSQTLLSI
ncbi:gfo/Idh/MocA family oxidoreductase [Alginatibacterium sediminis]|uniref:Gfo/Idh/MocA family oxidoreductase n=1 Tax=Alginatibacterium sediminis TaxID=2164068 RepID=A0A420E9V2_9ALTE|nr:Gfo/Idh/MocA family oxidoreductase [Alginatibacterium sediminis]RKF17452.1 gfo/Idh/MocA family oxidoreductase [Alginatibacterium sediminis]